MIIIYTLLFVLPMLSDSVDVGISLGKVGVLVCFITLCARDRKFVFYKDLNFLLFSLLFLITPLLFHREYSYIIFQFTDLLLPVYIGRRMCDIEKKTYDVIRIFVSSAFVMSICGIIEAFTSFDVFAYFLGFKVERFAANGYRMGIARAASSFNNSINYCVYLWVISFFCFFLYRYYSDLKYKIELYIIVIGAILTLSRGPIFIASIIWFVILLRSGILKNKLVHLIVLLPIMFFIIYLNWNSDGIIKMIRVGIMSLLNKESVRNLANTYGFGGFETRIGLFVWVPQRLKGYWLLGRGYNYKFLQWIGRYASYKEGVENVYLATLLSSGIVGLIGKMNVFIIPVNKIRRKLEKKKESFYASIFFYGIASLMFFMLSGFTVSYTMEIRIMLILSGYLVGVSDNYEDTWMKGDKKTY
ncbi:hypothetical protein [Butyrivibrio fibrisolvens]|uniref:hypothetical protein n=1 Tax=Butyrivibrio fibrisolvens TaxID=831 RepID=UPI0003FC61BD|nr:hypothetical protein [Butyrivibrio fibrisolvens]